MSVALVIVALIALRVDAADEKSDPIKPFQLYGYNGRRSYLWQTRLGFAALRACLFPARRVNLLNPAGALRVE